MCHPNTAKPCGDKACINFKKYVILKLKFRLWLLYLPNELVEILIDGSHTVNGRGEVHEFLRGLGFLSEKINFIFQKKKLTSKMIFLRREKTLPPER